MQYRGGQAIKILQFFSIFDIDLANRQSRIQVIFVDPKGFFI